MGVNPLIHHGFWFSCQLCSVGHPNSAGSRTDSPCPQNLWGNEWPKRIRPRIAHRHNRISTEVLVTVSSNTWWTWIVWVGHIRLPTWIHRKICCRFSLRANFLEMCGRLLFETKKLLQCSTLQRLGLFCCASMYRVRRFSTEMLHCCWVYPLDTFGQYTSGKLQYFPIEASSRNWQCSLQQLSKLVLYLNPSAITLQCLPLQSATTGRSDAEHQVSGQTCCWEIVLVHLKQNRVEWGWKYGEYASSLKGCGSLGAGWFACSQLA